MEGFIKDKESFKLIFKKKFKIQQFRELLFSGLPILPGCCIYALQRTALDNVSSYSIKATNTVMRNLYVDEVLKSVPSVRDALTLIQEVGDLCKRGGINLTKFISNKKDMLFQIPDALRRDAAKDKDLTGSLPIERSLEIFCDAEDDVINSRLI